MNTCILRHEQPKPSQLKKSFDHPQNTEYSIFLFREKVKSRTMIVVVEYTIRNCTQTPHILQPVHSHKQKVQHESIKKQYMFTTNSSYQQYTSQSRRTHIPLLRRPVKTASTSSTSPLLVLSKPENTPRFTFSDLQRLFD